MSLLLSHMSDLNIRKWIACKITENFDQPRTHIALSSTFSIYVFIYFKLIHFMDDVMWHSPRQNNLSRVNKIIDFSFITDVFGLSFYSMHRRLWYIQYCAGLLKCYSNPNLCCLNVCISDMKKKSCIIMHDVSFYAVWTYSTLYKYLSPLTFFN